MRILPLIPRIIGVLEKAGRAIVNRQKSVSVMLKRDGSPVTDSDILSQQIIVDEIRKIFPELPLVAEESELPASLPSEFLLLDPLDGTKSYIKGEKNYSINLAIIAGGKPIFSAISAPAYSFTFVHSVETGSFLHRHIKERIIPHEKDTDNKIKIVTSKDHLDGATSAFMEKLRKNLPEEISVYNMGSAVKFCLLSLGVFHIYPRLLTNTNLWDLLPGFAILAGCGGEILLPVDTIPLDLSFSIPFIAISPYAINIKDYVYKLAEEIWGKYYKWVPF